MCGIYSVINKDCNKAAEIILTALKKLDYRGYDSWGIAVLDKASNKLIVDKHPGKISNATTQLPNTIIGIGHTRWATHGNVTKNNAHPHLDCSNQLAVVHNGIVENYLSLKSDLAEQGHTFRSDTDSEVIVHLIEESMKTLDFKQAVFKAFSQLKGSNAFVVVSSTEKSVIACRNGSPLIVGKGRNSFAISSDVYAFEEGIEEFYSLEDGEAAVLTTSEIQMLIILENKELKVQFLKKDWDTQSNNKGNYPHYFLKEINEQPTILQKMSTRSESEFSVALQLIRGKEIFFVGCGSAYHAGLFGQSFLRQQRVGSQVVYAHEFDTVAPLISSNSVIIAISQSGETADTLLAVKLAKQKGAQIVSILNNLHSSLARISDVVLPVDAGQEVAVVSTKAMTAQVATLYLLCSTLQGKFSNAQKNIGEISTGLQSWLSSKKCKKIQVVAEKLAKSFSLFLIAKGLLIPAVFEMSLKVKESSYIHSEAFPAGELKHGVLSLIENNIPCVISIQNDAYLNDALSAAMEIYSRGGNIIEISSEKYFEYSEHIKIPTSTDLECFYQIVVGQLLGYYLAIERGLDPDKPRNLAKSVTVK